ncbi:uncharacterized protein BXZ73DRAFT_2512, partial [Epithele typhae]|uniref:uncharacterized protein n=1 Tax=Epithele typhae TaxID=378194 RepID=UPI0020081223
EENVVAPHISAPAAGAQWAVGSVQTVVWDTADVPPEAWFAPGTLVLGHVEEGSTNEHLDLMHPLAEGFLLISGKAKVTVPSVEARDDYVVVLIGDSGNVSGKFSI